MTHSLAKLSNEVISSNERMSEIQEQIKSETICLLPDTLNFGLRPEFKISATLVSVDTGSLKNGNNRDIYRTDSGQYALHLNKINEIAKTAGLNVTGSKVSERQVDGDGRVVYISHEIKGNIRAIDGSIKEDVATGKYDYYNDVATKSEGQVKSRRKHAEALAESNAKTRLFNKLVTKLPQSFTLEELKKPFFVPCVVEDKNELIKSLPKDVQDRVNEDYVRKQLGISSKIYGGPTQSALSQGSDNNGDLLSNNVSSSNDNIDEATIIEDGNGFLSEEEKNKITAEEFRNSPQSERTKKILDLIKEKDWSHPKGAIVTEAMIEKSDLDKQITTIHELLNYQKEESL